MHHHHRTNRRSRRAGVLAVAAASALVLGACGDDDDDTADEAAATTAAVASPDTTAAAAAPTAAGADTTAAGADTTAGGADTTAAGTDTTAGSDTTAGGAAAGGDVDAFCQAELAAEAAASSEDPSAAGPAFEALVAASPEEIRPTVEEVIANAESGPGDPAFDEPYGEMVQFVRDNCGFNELAVTATEYSFDGLPAELEAGPTVVSFENEGAEVHEVFFIRVNDGVTETMEELLALPEEEASQKTTMQAGAFAFPGASSATVTDFTPGRYLALCFLPVGAAPEIIAQMEGPESTTPPGVELGPPHFTQGMAHEFTVT
jgi:hypothetical protein